MITDGEGAVTLKPRIRRERSLWSLFSTVTEWGVFGYRSVAKYGKEVASVNEDRALNFTAVLLSNCTE